MGSLPRATPRVSLAAVTESLRSALPTRRAAADAGSATPSAPRTILVNLGKGDELDRGPRFLMPTWMVGLTLPTWIARLKVPAWVTGLSLPERFSSVGVPARISGLKKPAWMSSITLPARPSKPARVSRDSLPGGLLSHRGLIAAAGLCMVVVGIGAITQDAGSLTAATGNSSAVQAAERPATAAKPAAPTNPFDQRRINQELRTLRSNLGSGETARNLLVLADGTMGTMAVRGQSAENIMAQSTEFVREPIADWTSLLKAPVLDLKSVHGVAPTKVLTTAQSLFKLPPSQLVSLKLEPTSKRDDTFIWTATYRDAKQSVVYADREGESVSTLRPQG